MRRFSKNTRAHENPLTGETGRAKYSILPSTACRDAGVTVAQYKVLRQAITLPHGLAAFAVRPNVLRNMVTAELVAIVKRPWGEAQELVEVVEPTEKGRLAYESVTDAA